MPDTDPDPILIRHLKPRNFLSFGPDNEGIELRALNLLIGPNGSGKSNFIEALSFMRSSSKDMPTTVRKGGGVENWIWKGGNGQNASIILEIANPATENPLVHRIIFQAFMQRFDLVEEAITEKPSKNGMGKSHYLMTADFLGPTVYTDNKPEEGRILLKPEQSILTLLRDPNRYPELFLLSKSYERIRIYREWSFGRNSVFREPQKADMRNDILEEDFSNLGLFLNRLKTRFPAAKRALLEALKNLYDGIDDFEVSIEGGTVQVFFIEGTFSIPATRLSDGTLRYLCLLAILCDPEPPPLICIEEPELGLHPDILPKLADLMKAASARTQLIVTTHSDILVDAMTETPDCVVVCEKRDGKTEMTRLSAADLSVWLEKYRLGQLWIQGQIGGTRW